MFDVLTIAALADEFATRLVGGRIQRVVQIDAATVGLEVYAAGQRRTLVASADSQNPRLYLTAERVSGDPERVTPLLLLLRKYTRGGRIVGVEQPPLERILTLSLAKRFLDEEGEAEAGEDEVAGRLVYTHLTVELMGRRSNVVLTDDTGRILDAVKRVTPEMSRVRPILPGRPYAPPPAPPRQDPRLLGPGGALDLLRGAAADAPVADVLVRGLAAFSPQMGREAAFRAFADAEIACGDALAHPDAGERLAEAVADLLAQLASGAWSPAVYRVDDRPVAFAAIRLRHLKGVAAEEPAATMSEAIARFLAESGQAAPARHGQRRERLVSQIRGARERVAARLRSLTEERERAEAGERWREMGELIYAYLAQIAPGQTALDVDGYHIPLDPALTPSENAQAYFERYRKARSATATLPERIEETRTELAYLEQLETLAGLAEGIDEIEQIQREWEAYAGARAGAPGKGKREPAPKRPRPYRTQRGDLIYVGHNGRQNDLVTFDIAGPDDTWLHARDLPGAHVVVHWAGPEDEALLERAASLAAYYSAGRSSTRVEVDIAPRRYVRKIKGAGPGMVTYRNERTVSVRPESPEALGLA